MRQRELIDQQRRLKLALTFATAFLRFYGTPWLDEDLTKDVMHTFRSGNSATATLTNSFYISQSFPVRRSSSTATSETTAVKDSARSIVHRNQDTFAPGLLLIELALNERLEDLYEPSDLDVHGQASAFSPVIAAERLLPEVYAKQGARYGRRGAPLH
jgi:hypothetical protein